MSGRRSSIPFAAVWEPVIRDRMIAWVERMEAGMQARGATQDWYESHGVPWRDVVRECERQKQALQAADLYYVRSDMVSLAVSAAVGDGELPFMAPPSDVGFILFEGGITPLRASTGEVSRFYGMLWWMEDGHIRYDVLADVMLASMGVRVKARKDYDMHADLHEVGEGWRDPESLLSRILRALFALMNEPGVAETEHGAKPRRLERVPSRVSEQAKHVRVIDVREHTGGGTRDGDGDGTPGRKHAAPDHRFIVSGHWRDQPYGPGRSQRRRQWIAPYIKGPKDKPLRLDETVRVLRR